MRGLIPTGITRVARSVRRIGCAPASRRFVVRVGDSRSVKKTSPVGIQRRVVTFYTATFFVHFFLRISLGRSLNADTIVIVKRHALREARQQGRGWSSRHHGPTRIFYSFLKRATITQRRNVRSAIAIRSADFGSFYFFSSSLAFRFCSVRQSVSCSRRPESEESETHAYRSVKFCIVFERFRVGFTAGRLRQISGVFVLAGTPATIEGRANGCT